MYDPSSANIPIPPFSSLTPPHIRTPPLEFLNQQPHPFKMYQLIEQTFFTRRPTHLHLPRLSPRLRFLHPNTFHAIHHMSIRVSPTISDMLIGGI